MSNDVDRNDISVWAQSQDIRCRDFGWLFLKTENAKRLREMYRRKAIDLAQYANDFPDIEVIFTTKDRVRHFIGDADVCTPYFETDSNGVKIVDIKDDYVPCIEYIKRDVDIKRDGVEYDCIDYTVYLSSVDNRCAILIQYS